MLTIPAIPCLSANNSRINLFCLISRRRSCLFSAPPIYTPTEKAVSRHLALATAATDWYVSVFGKSTGFFLRLHSNKRPEQKGKHNSRNRTRKKKHEITLNKSVAYSCMAPGMLTFISHPRRSALGCLYFSLGFLIYLFIHLRRRAKEFCSLFPSCSRNLSVCFHRSRFHVWLLFSFQLVT